MQREQSQALDPNKIVAAFQIIINNSNPRDIIKEADNYLSQCQNNEQFAQTLMMIFDKVNNTQKWQVLIHLNNVIRRNWTTPKRKGHDIGLSEEKRIVIKDGLVQLYKNHWEIYYKQFNQIFKFFAKYEFPGNYQSLSNFLLQILRTLANSEIEILIAPKQLLPYLSLVKTVYKQNSRKLTHTKQSYLQHIAQPVKLANIIFQKINNALLTMKNISDQNINVNTSNRILECSRKIDKIILYCLNCSVGSMQRDNSIKEIIYNLVMKMELLLALRRKKINQQIQLNLYAILEGLSKLQVRFPFYFTNFLHKYLQAVLHLLISQVFQNEELVKCVITSNTKPLTIVPYYLSQSQFKDSIQSKKGSGLIFIEQQQICHEDYLKIYGGSNSTAFMQKAILQLMQKYSSRQDNYIMFEQTQNTDGSAEYSCFQLLLTLLRNLILRFKEQFKPFTQKMIDHLIQNQLTPSSSKTVMNMYEVILLLPKVYDEVNMKVDKAFQLMQMCFHQNHYGMFSRLIKGYCVFCNPTIIAKSFEILVSIISNPNTDHQTLFHCAVCVKKILCQHPVQELPVQRLGNCLGNLLKLASLYKETPTHLWNLLQIINQILKMVSNEATIANLEYIAQHIHHLSLQKNNDEVTVAAISDMLENIMEIISVEQINNEKLINYLYQISIDLVGTNICNPKIENLLPLIKLWLSVIRNIRADKCSQDFNQKLLNALFTMKNKIIAEDPALFLQFMEEYILAGLLNLTEENLLNVAQEILGKIPSEDRPRTYMAIFSVYFTYYLLTKNFIPKFLILAMEQIIAMKNTLNQHFNILRTFLILIINHHILELGNENIFGLFNQNFNNHYRNWYQPYLWSLEYLNSKYACKVSSLALFSSLGMLEKSGILFQVQEQWAPLQKIMKVISFQIDPVNVLSATISYQNSFKMMMKKQQKISKMRPFELKNIPRKFRFHINQEWAQCDLTQLYRDKFGQILENMGWNLQTIDSRFDKMTSTKIISILTNQQNQEKV